MFCEKIRAYLLKKSSHISRWEAILLVILALAVLSCGWLSWRQSELSSRLIRLHVVANSDTQEDQDLKLAVRDAVLQSASDYLEGISDVGEAEAILQAHLGDLSAAGQAVVAQAGYPYPVTAVLEDICFPTKSYDGFALPAGEYRALRVQIGSGQGHNWWCVVFPTLCVSAASEFEDVAVSGGLSEDDVALMSGEDEGYVLRFKCLELWGELCSYLKGESVYPN